MGALSERWLEDLAELREAGDAHPAEVRAMRTFASIASRTTVLAGLTVALYPSDDVDAPADVLVPFDVDAAPYLPWSGWAEVRGVAEPGRGVSLTCGHHTVLCSGPLTVPLPWARRRVRNRPPRRPRPGPWSATVGSALDPA